LAEGHLLASLLGGVTTLPRCMEAKVSRKRQLATQHTQHTHNLTGTLSGSALALVEVVLVPDLAAVVLVALPHKTSDTHTQTERERRTHQVVAGAIVDDEVVGLAALLHNLLVLPLVHLIARSE
jgi:hypothetical protein